MTNYRYDWGIIKREEYGTCRFPKLREPQKQVDQNFANARIYKQEMAEAPHMDRSFGSIEAI